MQSELNDATESRGDKVLIENELCCAYRKYPEPIGITYYAKDLRTPKAVEQLFDYCQILEAVIYEVGWGFLIEFYGYATLFQINQASGWFDCSDVEEFRQYVLAYRDDMKKAT